MQGEESRDPWLESFTAHVYRSFVLMTIVISDIHHCATGFFSHGHHLSTTLHHHSHHRHEESLFCKKNNTHTTSSLNTFNQILNHITPKRDPSFQKAYSCLSKCLGNTVEKGELQKCKSEQNYDCLSSYLTRKWNSSIKCLSQCDPPNAKASNISSVGPLPVFISLIESEMLRKNFL